MQPSLPSISSKREIVVRSKPGLPYIFSGGRVRDAEHSAYRIFEEWEGKGVTFRPTLAASAAVVDPPRIGAGDISFPPLPDLSRYLTVNESGADIDQLVLRLRAEPRFDAAYIVTRPSHSTVAEYFKAMPQAVDGQTPDYSASQVYLGVNPGGVNALAVRTRAGARGAAVKVADVQFGWCFEHEDLAGITGGLVFGQSSSKRDDRDHGTAVAGVIRGDDNGFGVTGIAPDCEYSGYAADSPSGVASAIQAATAALSSGDVIVIELSTADDDPNGACLPVEWYPEVFDAIRMAAAKGIAVVAAAGNLGIDLLNSSLDAAPPGFPPDWSNPFRRGARDSGSILVGAGAPYNSYAGWPDRSRMTSSNFGECVDAQGWGYQVTTCGFGMDTNGSNDERRSYTESFTGTSSATAIVAGTVAALQGVARAAGNSIAPSALRVALRETGSPQVDFPGQSYVCQRIGNRPDLLQLLAYFNY